MRKRALFGFEMAARGGFCNPALLR